MFFTLVLCMFDFDVLEQFHLFYQSDKSKSKRDITFDSITRYVFGQNRVRRTLLFRIVAIRLVFIKHELLKLIDIC